MVIQDKTRRMEVGKMFVDIAKYVFTIVVIGGLVSDRINVGNILFGFVIAAGTAVIGFFVIPSEEEKPS